VTFTVSCSGGSSPPPGGGNEYAYVYTDINAPSNVSWTVYLYFDGQLDATYQGSGSQNYGPAVFSSSGTVSYKVSGIPNTCSVSYSPSQSFSITPGNSYTETITITCQGQQPPPPPSNYFCIINPSASDNVGGESGAYVWPSTTQYIPPGQSLMFTWTAQNNPVQYNGETYYFNNWAATLNGQSIQTTSPQYLSTSYTFTCPSNLSSNQTYTLSGEAVYWPRYLKVGGGDTFNVNGNGTYSITSQYTTAYFYWSDPLFISGSWSVQGSSYGDSFTISVTLNDYYSESATATPLSASTTLAIQGPAGYACTLTSNGVSESGSINTAQASNWLPTSATVTITCVPQSTRNQ
jgi:hypothetical protein